MKQDPVDQLIKVKPRSMNTHLLFDKFSLYINQVIIIRQEIRKLLRKKIDSFPEEPMESRETNNDCSLDLSPNPDSNLFGNREESEEESSSAESEDDSEKEGGSDATIRDLAPETEQQEEVEPSGGSHWTTVTPRKLGQRSPIVNSNNRRQPSPAPTLRRHRIRDVWSNQDGKRKLKTERLLKVQISWCMLLLT